MGCTSSTEHADGQPKRKPTPADVFTKPNSSTPLVEEKKMFIGVSPNQVVLCRDEFQSKYTEELMYRWRPAEVLTVEGDHRNRLLIHYTGWADTFDHWVDLETDISKLAPMGLLSKDQCNKGGELTEEQKEITLEYFLLGKECAPFEEPVLASKELSVANSMSNSEDATQKAIETALNVVRLPAAPVVAPSSATAPAPPAPVIAKRRTSAGPSLRPPGEETDSDKSATLSLSPPIVPPVKTASPSPTVQQQTSQQQQSLPVPPPSVKKILAPVRLTAATDPNKNPYVYGEKVDVLDIFFKKGATVPSQKWRSADVVEVVGEYITIHYQNWDDKYNERLHFIRDAHRLSPAGSRTRPSNGHTNGHSSGPTNNVSSTNSVTSRSSHSRSAENMRTRSESGGSFSVSNGSHLVGGASSSAATSSGSATPISAPPSHFLRPPSGHPPENTSSGVAKRLSYTDENSELDKGHRRVVSVPAPIVTTAPLPASRSISSDRHSVSESKTLSLSTPSTDHSDNDLTPEQRNFTRNFYNYKKKKQAEVQAAIGSISEDGPAEESKKSLDSKGSRKVFAKMTFGGLFGSAKDGTVVQSLTSKSGSPRSLGRSASNDQSENADTEDASGVVAVEAEPVEDERNEEEIAARERTFLEKLEAKGLHVFAIEGDGNCLFRAVSHQLYLEQDMHDELRARCVEHLIRHRKRFEVFCDGDFDEHLKEMSKSGTWGDDLEIRALEEITDRVITIYSSNVESSYEPINNNFEEKNLLQGVPPLTLSYHGQSHYNSIYDERYPLPLVERKSRLLLRSRLALTQQDLLPSLSSQSGDSSRQGSNQGSPRHSTSANNGSRVHQNQISDHNSIAANYNYIARSSSTGNGSMSTHMNGSYSQYDDYDAYPQPLIQVANSYQQPPHSTPMHHSHNIAHHNTPHQPTPHGHPGHPPAHPQLVQMQTPYGYRQGYVNQLGQFIEADDQDYYEQAAYEPGFADSFDPSVYEQDGYIQDYNPNDYPPSESQHMQPHIQQQPYLYNNGYVVHPSHQQTFNYGYAHGISEYNHNDGY